MKGRRPRGWPEETKSQDSLRGEAWAGRAHAQAAGAPSVTATPAPPAPVTGPRRGTRPRPGLRAVRRVPAFSRPTVPGPGSRTHRPEQFQKCGGSKGSLTAPNTHVAPQTPALHHGQGGFSPTSSWDF